ncbi:MAG: AmmeMemoRadiSam system protein B [Candidatus Omnitrophica bacterium]|nr:AmmeMemoRadiSam system protein B [Candidatus Omnitrophota bacterium]
MTGVIRRPAVAGYLYPADPAEAAQAIDRLMDRTAAAAPALAAIVPHGSWAQCGAVIAAALSRMVLPRRCVVIGPSHTGTWMPWSLLEGGWYRTPLGDVPVDRFLADALRRRCPFLEVDAWAQHGEHAIEVVLPFLQRLSPSGLCLVPIISGSDDAEQFFQLGEALAQVVRMAEEPVLLVASSDLSHYEPCAETARQDERLLAAIRALDGAAVLHIVREAGVRMCGYGAVVSVLEAAKRLGAREAHIERYGTSAQTGGDADSAIGYAGVRISHG